jgi:hypothetical protein
MVVKVNHPLALYVKSLLITGKVLQELSQKGLRAITQIYNAILRIAYFPCQWNVGQIIMIAKPRKNSDDITSYRPISLLPILSMIAEKRCYSD